MKSMRTAIKPEETIRPEETNANSTKTAKEYFKLMGADIRGEISKYLSNREIKNLNMISREFHGPIGKAKFKYKHEKKELKWAKKTFSKAMKPTMKLLNKSTDLNINPIVGFGLFCASTALAVPNTVVAASATPIGFCAGAIKEVKDKVKTKIKEKHANDHIRPFEGEQITFKK